MELAIDVEIDLPKVWACLAEQIGSIFTESGGKIALHSLKEMTRPLMQAKKAHLFVAEVLKKLIRHMVGSLIFLRAYFAECTVSGH